MVPSGTKIDKQQLNVSAHADGIVLVGWKKWNRNKTTFCRNGKQFGMQTEQGNTKYMILERKKVQNKIKSDN